MTIYIIFAAVCGLVLGLWLMHFLRNKIPFVDYGHRCFAVRDEKTAKLLLCLFKRFGLHENFTFSPGKTHQTLLSDGTTVLIWFNESLNGSDLPKNGLSVVSADPPIDAAWFATELRARDYQATIRHDVFPSHLESKVTVLVSNAFPNWALVFRHHSLKMGKRPNLRRITPV